MARKVSGTARFPMVRNVLHHSSKALSIVSPTIRRQEIDTQLRLNAEEQDERTADAEEQDERIAIRRQSSDAGRLERAIANRARAHRTMMGILEGVPGAPRSGSA